MALSIATVCDPTFLRILSKSIYVDKSKPVQHNIKNILQGLGLVETLGSSFSTSKTWIQLIVLPGDVPKERDCYSFFLSLLLNLAPSSHLAIQSISSRVGQVHFQMVLHQQCPSKTTMKGIPVNVSRKDICLILYQQDKLFLTFE